MYCYKWLCNNHILTSGTCGTIFPDRAWGFGRFNFCNAVDLVSSFFNQEMAFSKKKRSLSVSALFLSTLPGGCTNAVNQWTARSTTIHVVPNIVSPTCKQGCCRGVQQQERATICANNHCPSFTPLRHCLQFIGNLTFHSNSGRPDCRTPKAPPLPRHILGDGRLLFALPPRHCNSTNLSQISLMKVQVPVAYTSH